MKHALCLSGGGFKGIFQVAAVKVLREQGITFNAVSGISTGALNGALIAMDKIDILQELWGSVQDSEGGTITNGNLFDIKKGKLKPNFNRIKDVGMQGISKWDITTALTSTFFKGKKLEEVGTKLFDNIDYSTGLLDNAPLKALLMKHIIRQDFKMPYYFGLTEMTTGEGYELNNKDFASDTDLANAVLASATMPVIWDSVRFIQTKKLSIKESVDGGLRTVSPLGQLFDTIERSKESEEWTIWIINCNSQELGALEDVQRQSVRAGRVIDILLNQIFRDDLKMTLLINENADKFDKRKVNINIIEPQKNTIGGTLDARPETMIRRIEIAKALTLNYF